jgi:hypothetical protein
MTNLANSQFNPRTIKTCPQDNEISNQKKTFPINITENAPKTPITK